MKDLKIERGFVIVFRVSNTLSFVVISVRHKRCIISPHILHFMNPCDDILLTNLTINGIIIRYSGRNESIVSHPEYGNISQSVLQHTCLQKLQQCRAPLRYKLKRGFVFHSPPCHTLSPKITPHEVASWKIFDAMGINLDGASEWARVKKNINLSYSRL